MEVRLYHDPMTAQGLLFVWERTSGRETAYRTAQGVTVVPEGSPMEPIMRLPWREWSAVCGELIAHGLAPVDPGNDATKKHLSDAIAIRDRLLTMVEKRK